MLQLLLSAFTWMFTFALPPVVSEAVWFEVGAIYCEHEGGLVTLSTGVEGVVVTSFTGAIRDGTTPGIAGGGIIGVTILPRTRGAGVDMEEPVPVIRTSWTSAGNVQHEVVTPVVSTTPAGIRKATEVHDALVANRQARYPPT